MKIQKNLLSLAIFTLLLRGEIAVAEGLPQNNFNTIKGDVSMSENKTNAPEGFWEKTKEISGDVWEATKEGTEKAWKKTKEFSADAWDKTKKLTSGAEEDIKEESADTWDKTKEKTKTVWKEVKDSPKESSDKTEEHFSNNQPDNPLYAQRSDKKPRHHIHK